MSHCRKAVEYFEKHLRLAIEIGDKEEEGRTYKNLFIAYLGLGDYQKAIEYHEKCVKLAVEIGDQGRDGKLYELLGDAYCSLGKYQKAIEYHEKQLKIAIEISDRKGEGRAYGKLGVNCRSLGHYRKAVEYHEQDLKIAKENSDQAREEIAYGDLGNTYKSLGDYWKAIDYHEKALKIAIEIGDQDGEARAYGNLGNNYQSQGDYRKAIEYLEKNLKIAIEIGNQNGEARAYGDLGIVYWSLGDYRKAIEYHKKRLQFAKEHYDRAGEGRANGNLSNAYHSLGDYQKAMEYCKEYLKISIEVGDQGEQARAYGNLGNVFRSLNDYRNAIKYYKKDLKIAIEIGDLAGEGKVYGNLGGTYESLGDHQKAVEYSEKYLKIAIKISDRAGEGGVYGNLGMIYKSMGDYQKALKYFKKQLKIATEIDDHALEGSAYHNIGYLFLSLEQFQNAVDNYFSAVNAFNSLRSLLKTEYDWKMKFRELHQTAYTGLWVSLLGIGKVDEALLAAERGRAQALSDNLLVQYRLSASLSATSIDIKETICPLFRDLITPTIFLGSEGLTINIWLLSRGNKVVFRKGRLEGDGREEDPIQASLQSSLEKIRTEDTGSCEDRTFDEFNGECPFSIDVRSEGPVNPPLPPLDNPFKSFYDAVIDPILDILGPQDDELVIVPDGALCFTPWAAVSEAIRIRIVPSLTSYHLILSAPKGHHKKTGALLVGNPCLGELKKPLDDLPCAEKEVEMIAAILNTRPLTGRDATKAEVMKWMSSVSLIHIAAHGNELTGEIALSPNPGWTSKFPRRDDYILRMSDVQAADLRARLVVLSCCHSGRGRILKGEGVVGIARAFLAAGARSVLVTLWAIDDEATMVFMKSFYQHLKEGKTASAAVQQSMKSLRESDEYSEMRYWAPFQLIGDDVKIKFVADDDVKK